MIDPGGLKVKGADRNGAMRTLAENTDGIAVLNINDLDKGFDRISNDMASYYLLGYYASNTTPDGRFRSITVRVKQPGVQVRARKGYRAPSENDIRPPAAITSGAAGAPSPVQGSTRATHPDSSGHTVPRRCRRRSGPCALVVGGWRASGNVAA